METVCLGRADRLKLYLALSRTPHGLLDMAAPVFTALVWLGRFPGPGVTTLGLLTAFAAYTAVYAVNDLADLPTDRANFADGEQGQDGYLDAVYARHPMAQGLLSHWRGLAWAAGWGAAALAGAWLLNPVCAGLLLAGCVLEVVYCLLLKVTHLRALLNGVVKTLGPVAAVIAVDPAAPGWFLGLVFATVFAWEIGGQNIPADWFDLELDQAQKARTMPLVLGTERAARLALGCLSAATACLAVLLWVAPAGLPALYVLIGTLGVAWLLVLPAWRLRGDPSRDKAAALFNRASYFPAAMLGLVLCWFALR